MNAIYRVITEKLDYCEVIPSQGKIPPDGTHDL